MRDFWLAKKLEYAIQNSKKLKWLSYNDVKNHFSWKTSIEEYFKVYQKLK